MDSILKISIKEKIQTIFISNFIFIINNHIKIKSFLTMIYIYIFINRRILKYNITDKVKYK